MYLQFWNKKTLTYAITHSLVYSVEMHWDRQTCISKKSTDGCSRGNIIQYLHMHKLHMQIKILKTAFTNHQSLNQ